MASRRGEQLLRALQDQRLEQPETSSLHEYMNSSGLGGALSDSMVPAPLDSDASNGFVEQTKWLEWALWTVASAIPIFGAAGWLTIALRKRKPAFYYETLTAALWPFAGYFVLFIASIVFAFVDSLLFYRYDARWLAYGEEAKELTLYHDAYQWVGSTVQLGEIQAVEFAFVQTNQGLHRLETYSQVAILALLIALPVMWLASLVHAQRMWLHRFPVNEPPASDEKNNKLFISTLALWALFGWMGAHRFYLGRWITGLFYLFSFGGAGIGWAADLFWLRSGVVESNAATTRRAELAPWSEGARFGIFDFLIRWCFFVAASAAFVTLCITFSQLELLLVLLFTLVVCGLFGNLNLSMERLRFLEQVPFVRPTMAVLKQLYQFYYETAPRSFLFYAAGPILGPFELIRSSSFRHETKLYLRFSGAILGAALINQVRLIPTTYRYHSNSAIALWMAIHIVAALAVSWLILPPILTTAFAFNLTGRHRRLRVLSISALCMSFAMGLFLFGYNYISEAPNVVSYSLIRTRLEDETFQKQLTDSTQLFLNHYLPKVPKPLDDFYPMASHPELTRRYHDKVLRVLIPGNEAKVFRVFTMDVEGDSPDGAWVGVGVLPTEDEDQGWRTLFLMGPDKQLHTWSDKDLPPRVAENFELASALWKMQYEHRLARRSPIADQRLYDRVESFLRQRKADLSSNSDQWRIQAAWVDAPPGEDKPAVFDPRSTRLLRASLEESWGDECLQFRVFLLPPTGEDGWWLGVCDGDRPLCVLAPWGDYFREWDREVFARYQHVLTQFERLSEARRRPSTYEALEDIQLERARDFLAQYYPAADTAEVLSEYAGEYIDRERPGKGVWLVEEASSAEQRWLLLREATGSRYLMGRDRRIYVQTGRGRFKNLVGQSPPDSIVAWASKQPAPVAQDKSPTRR